MIITTRKETTTGNRLPQMPRWPDLMPREVVLEIRTSLGTGKEPSLGDDTKYRRLFFGSRMEDDLLSMVHDVHPGMIWYL